MSAALRLTRTGKQRWRFVSDLSGGLDTAPAEPRWLLTRGGQGALRAGRTALLGAQGGAGKTALLCDLALRVATGTRWMGTFEVVRPGKVMLVLGEEDEEEALRRIFRASRAGGLPQEVRRTAAENIMLVPLAGVSCALLELTGEGNYRRTSFGEELREQAQGHEWSLVILDPLSRFGGEGVEDSSSAATRFVQELESLCKLPGEPAVMCAHHTTKSSRDTDKSGKRRTADNNSFRGSGALTDGVRWAATLTKEADDGGGVEFRVTKSNYSPEGAPVRLERVSGGFEARESFE